MALIDAYNYVIDACNDAYIGYSQTYRKTIQLGVTYRTYCDCTSLMSKALTVAGYFSVNPWFYSGNMISYMSSIGWDTYDPATTEWQAGDILLRYGRADQVNHAEMVYQGRGTAGITMGAHYAGLAFADQVSINTAASNGTAWDYLFRDPDAGLIGVSWQQSDGSGGLTNDQVTQNATLINYYFSSRGATEEAICALLGNFQFESGLDPNKYYGGVIGSATAYGLPQFHPTSNYQYIAAQNGIDVTDADANGEYQLTVIDQDLLGGWIPTTDYPYTWAEFLQLTDLEEATKAFYYEYERAGSTFNTQRLTYAQAWYGYDWPSDPGGSVGRYYPWLWGALNNLRRRKLI